MGPRTFVVAAGLLVAGCQQEGSSPFGSDQEATGSGLELAACTSAPGDMVSWWPGDGHPNDIDGQNHGSLQSGATYAAGMVGQAFSFNGSGANVLIGNPPSLQLSGGNFTFDAWVRFSSIGGDHIIGGKIHDGSGGLGNADGWMVLKQADDRVWFCLGNGSNGCFPGAPTTVISTTTVAVDTWYHVAAVLGSSEIAIYVNGVREDFKARPAFVDTHTANLRLGSAATGSGFFLHGLIDEVEIFSRELSTLEIAGIHAAGADGKCKPSCLGRTVTTTGTVNGSGQIELTGGSDVWVGTGAAETALGLGGNDWMCGVAGADSLSGGEGDDRLSGGNDGDVLLGENGADRMQGDAGADVLEGAGDDDALDGGTQADSLYGGTKANPYLVGSNNDRLQGGDDDDLLHGGDGIDVVDGGSGHDDVYGDEDGDTVTGGAGDDELEGGPGDDLLRGDGGADSFSGGDDTDKARAKDFVCGVDTHDGTVEQGIPTCP